MVQPTASAITAAYAMGTVAESAEQQRQDTNDVSTAALKRSYATEGEENDFWRQNCFLTESEKHTVLQDTTDSVPPNRSVVEAWGEADRDRISSKPPGDERLTRSADWARRPPRDKPAPNKHTLGSQHAQAWTDSLALVPSSAEAQVVERVARKLKKRKKQRKKKKRKASTGPSMSTSLVTITATSTNTATTSSRGSGSRASLRTRVSSSGFSSKSSKSSSRTARVGSVLARDIELEEIIAQRSRARSEASEKSVEHLRKHQEWCVRRQQAQQRASRHRRFGRRFLPALSNIWNTLQCRDAFELLRSQALVWRITTREFSRYMSRIQSRRALAMWKQRVAAAKRNFTWGHLALLERGTVSLSRFATLARAFPIWKAYAKVLTEILNDVCAAGRVLDDLFSHKRCRRLFNHWSFMTIGDDARRGFRYARLLKSMELIVRRRGTKKAFIRLCRVLGAAGHDKPKLRLKRNNARAVQRARREEQKAAARAAENERVDFSRSHADKLIREARRNQRRILARKRAGEETRIQILAREIQSSSSPPATGDRSERMTLHVNMPSGTTATLTDIPMDYKVDDIMLALQVVERKEMEKEKQEASRARRRKSTNLRSLPREDPKPQLKPQPFALTLVWGGKHLVEGRALNSYNIQSGSTLFALLRVLGGSLPQGSKRPTSVTDWMKGAYKYTASWKHVSGAQYCKIFQGEDVDSRGLKYGYNSDPEKDCKHVYTSSRSSPPVKVALRVVDHDNPSRVLAEAMVNMVCLTTKKTVFSGAATQQTNVMIHEDHGEYQIMVQLKSHRQMSHLSPLVINRVKRPSSSWDEPIRITVKMQFECWVRVRVVQEVPMCLETEKQAADRSDVDLYQAAVTLQASDGSKLELGRPESKTGNNWRVGKLAMPNTYRFCASISNFEQVNLLEPMHFDRSSWMEQESVVGGFMDFTVSMKLRPSLFVEVVDAHDTKVVLTSTSVEIEKLDTHGQPLEGPTKDHAVITLGCGGMRETPVDIPGVYAVRGVLQGYRQRNYLTPFHLNQSSWPNDRPLKVNCPTNSALVYKTAPTPSLSLIPAHIFPFKRLPGHSSYGIGFDTENSCSRS